MLGRVVCGSRTCICTIAAPALAASIDELAICSGVTGTAEFFGGESAEPVTAHEIMTLRCMVGSPSPRGGAPRYWLLQIFEGNPCAVASCRSPNDAEQAFVFRLWNWSC